MSQTAQRCAFILCKKRRARSASRWWRDYGCCSRAHAVEQFGEGFVKAVTDA